MITKLFLIKSLATSLVAGEIQWQPCNIEANGHTLKIGFKTDISTNDVGYWERKKMLTSEGFVAFGNASYITATNFIYYNRQPEEKPFPRTNVNEFHWEVYSNTYAMAVCDGTTNTLSESHVKLGDYFKKDSTVITTQTNTVSVESYTAVK